MPRERDKRMTSRSPEHRTTLLRQELDRFIRVVASQMGPQRILLFGSLAGGKMGEWSDLDLVVIADTTEDRGMIVDDAILPRITGTEERPHLYRWFCSGRKEQTYDRLNLSSIDLFHRLSSTD